MADPKPGDFVLSYQNFQLDDKNEPIPPFICYILSDKLRLWYVEYIMGDGTTNKRRINKGGCSSKPLDPRTVDPRYFDLFEPQPRVKLPTRVRL